MNAFLDREPMIRAIREALDKYDENHQSHSDNDGRALVSVLAIEPLIAKKIEGARGH